MTSTLERAKELKIFLKKECITTIDTYTTAEHVINQIKDIAEYKQVQLKDCEIYIGDCKYDDGKRLILSCYIDKTLEELNKDIENEEKRLINVQKQELETLERLEKKWRKV